MAEASNKEVRNADKKDKVKHPLQNEWDFYYYNKPDDKQADWQDYLLKISTFNTVEDFWELYYHTQPPSRLKPGCDYSFFKSGIRPNSNENNGRLVMLFRKNLQLNPAQKLSLQKTEDKAWLESCLCIIGDILGKDNDKVCGLVFNSRPKLDRISIWCKDFENKDVITKIANAIRQKIPVIDIFGEKHGNNKRNERIIYRFYTTKDNTLIMRDDNKILPRPK